MKNFTVEEINLMCCFNTSSRKRLIDDKLGSFSSPCMASSVLRAASKITSSASCFALKLDLSFAFWKASYTGLRRW